MKKILTALFALTTAASLFAADDADPFKSKKDKISYLLGMTYGKQLKQNDVELEYDQFLKGLKDSIAGAKTLLTEEQARATYTEFTQELRAKTQEKQKVEGEKNKKIGETFLAENKTKEGVQTTASGLQYKIETKGTGRIPGPNDTVVCHYRGTLIDGTEFDSSYKRGQPAEFGVQGVIKGWTEALQLMPVGSKWKLFIPADLAYGERGRPNIPASSTLLFDLEIVDIKAPGEAIGAPAGATPIGANPSLNPSPRPPQPIIVPAKGK
ncbi:MAG: FKBP-type peptidyl-prolyl cis-trans isomerase FklB [Verrucomicrobiota bacterium]|jgi:FKBP-type peptidyl-prolyl cis-trans isomerase